MDQLGKGMYSRSDVKHSCEFRKLHRSNMTCLRTCFVPFICHRFSFSYIKRSVIIIIETMKALLKLQSQTIVLSSSIFISRQRKFNDPPPIPSIYGRFLPNSVSRKTRRNRWVASCGDVHSRRSTIQKVSCYNSNLVWQSPSFAPSWKSRRNYESPCWTVRTSVIQKGKMWQSPAHNMCSDLSKPILMAFAGFRSAAHQQLSKMLVVRGTRPGLDDCTSHSLELKRLISIRSARELRATSWSSKMPNTHVQQPG